MQRKTWLHSNSSVADLYCPKTVPLYLQLSALQTMLLLNCYMFPEHEELRETCGSEDDGFGKAYLHIS